MNIGDFARLGPVSPRMLRHYDQHDLLQPQNVDRKTGYRDYSVTQLPRLHRILALRDLGFGIDEIRSLLQDEPTVEELRGMLRLRQTQLETSIEAEREQLRRVEAHLRALERKPMTSTNVVIKKSEPMRIAEMFQVAHGGGPANVGPVFGTLIPKLLGVFAQNGVTPGMSIGRYDDPTEDGALGVHVGFVIDDQEINAPEVSIVEVPSHEVASVVHQGPIDDISAWYADLYQWVEDSGRKPVANAIELYRNWDEQNPANNVTELQLPIG